MVQTDIPLFKQFVLSYLFVITLSMVLTLVVFQNAMDEYERQIREATRDQLKTQVALIDSRLQEIENITQKLALETDVIQLMRFPVDYDIASSYAFRRLYQSISLYPLTNSFIDEFFLYFLKPNVIISSNTIALKVPLYYKNFLAYENMDYQTWHDELVNNSYFRKFWPEKTIHREGVESRVITYLQTIPIGRTTERRALVFILINNETFHNYLKPLPFLTPASHITLYQEGAVMASWHPAEESQIPLTHDIVEYQSEFTGWLYQVSYPPSILDSNFGNIRNIFLISELIMLILGILLALYSSYRNSRPYYTLSKETERLKKQHRESFKEGLINGRFITEDDIAEQMDWGGFPFKGDSFQIALLTVSLFSNNSKSKEEILLILGGFIEKIRHLDRENLLLHHQAGKNQVVLILKDPPKREEFWKKLTDLMIEEKEQRKNDPDYEWEMHLLLGQIFSKLINTSLYYEELIHILDYLPPDRLNLVNHRDDFMEESGSCYYPLNQEQRLIQLTRQGNYEQVEEILDHLAQNNHKILDSPLDMEELEREMIGTLYRLTRQESCGPQEKEILNKGFILLKKAKQYSTFQNTIRQIYRDVCSLKWEKKEEENSLLVDKTKDILNENYHDPNLCLTLAADQLKVTGKHISRVFKEITGENFSVCLERIRMEKARELLSETSHKVVEIPLMVGYSNNNTFYKAFKRYFGVNPSSFR